jgi:hypothetical protein
MPALALVLTIAAFAAACGSSSNRSSDNASESSTPASTNGSSQATEWAQTFCSYAATWEKSLKAAAATARATKSADGLNAAITSAKTATTAFRAQMSRLGAPPTPNGSQAQQQVRSYAGQLQTAGQTLTGEIQQPASSASAVKEKAQSVTLTLKSMEMTLQRAYTQLTQNAGSGDLGPALKSAPACQTLFGKS